MKKKRETQEGGALTLNILLLGTCRAWSGQICAAPAYADLEPGPFRNLPHQAIENTVAHKLLEQDHREVTQCLSK